MSHSRELATRKKGNPTVVSKSFTQQVTCEKLYEEVRKTHGNRQLILFICGCEIVSEETQEYTKIGNRCVIPLQANNLAAFVPPGHHHYVIEPELIEDKLDPNELMTRGEFLIEILDIWEAMRERLSKGFTASLGKDLDTVIEYTKNVYGLEELMNLDGLGL